MRWAGNVPDDFDGAIFRLGGCCLLHRGDGVEELVSDVCEDSGTAAGDAVLSEKEEKAGEEVVDGGGRFELAEAVGEGGGEIGGVPLSFNGAVALAELRGRAGSSEAALAAGGRAVLAASENIGSAHWGTSFFWAGLPFAAQGQPFATQGKQVQPAPVF